MAVETADLFASAALALSALALGANGPFLSLTPHTCVLSSCALRSQPVASTAHPPPSHQHLATRPSRSSTRAGVAPKRRAACAPDGRRYEPLLVSHSPCLESQTVPRWVYHLKVHETKVHELKVHERKKSKVYKPN